MRGSTKRASGMLSRLESCLESGVYHRPYGSCILATNSNPELLTGDRKGRGDRILFVGDDIPSLRAWRPLREARNPEQKWLTPRRQARKGREGITGRGTESRLDTTAGPANAPAAHDGIACKPRRRGAGKQAHTTPFPSLPSVERIGDPTLCFLCALL